MSDRDKRFVFYVIIVSALIGMIVLSLAGCEAAKIARDALHDGVVR